MDSDRSITPIENDEDGTTLALGQGFVLNLQFDEESIRLRIEHEENSNEWYAESVARDFFDSRQKRSTIANEIARQTTLSSDWVGDRFREVREFIKAAEERMVADDAKRVMERTETIKGYQTPEELVVAIWLDAPEDSDVDGTRRIEFDSATFDDDSADPLKQKHFRAFVSRLLIADKDWQIVRDHWLDELELEQTETQSADDIIADRVADVLAKKVSDKVFDDEEALQNSETTAYYEPADESEYDEDTVWVQSPAIQQILDRQTDKSWAEYSGVLSRTLKRHGVTLGSSTRRRVPGGRATLWPFAADELRVGDLDVQQYGAEDSDDDLDIEQ